MTSEDRSNFNDTRDLCEDLSKILGMTRSLTHSFTRLVENALVHKLLIDNIDKDNINDIEIIVPFICKIVLEKKDNDIVVKNIILDNQFKSHIMNAIVDKKSPLIIEAESKLVDRIINKYNSLI